MGSAEHDGAGPAAVARLERRHGDEPGGVDVGDAVDRDEAGGPLGDAHEPSRSGGVQDVGDDLPGLATEGARLGVARPGRRLALEGRQRGGGAPLPGRPPAGPARRARRLAAWSCATTSASLPPARRVSSIARSTSWGVEGPSRRTSASSLSAARCCSKRSAMRSCSSAGSAAMTEGSAPSASRSVRSAYGGAGDEQPSTPANGNSAMSHVGARRSMATPPSSSPASIVPRKRASQLYESRWVTAPSPRTLLRARPAPCAAGRATQFAWKT